MYEASGWELGLDEFPSRGRESKVDESMHCSGLAEVEGRDEEDGGGFVAMRAELKQREAAGEGEKIVFRV